MTYIGSSRNVLLNQARDLRLLEAVGLCDEQAYADSIFEVLNAPSVFRRFLLLFLVCARGTSLGLAISMRINLEEHS